MIHKFSFIFGVDISINPKNISVIPYHFVSILLTVHIDFDITLLMKLLLILPSANFRARDAGITTTFQPMKMGVIYQNLIILSMGYN